MVGILERKLKAEIQEFMDSNTLAKSLYYARKFVEGLEECLVYNGFYERSEMSVESRLRILPPNLPHYEHEYQYLANKARTAAMDFMTSFIEVFRTEYGNEAYSTETRQRVRLTYRRIVHTMRFLLAARNRKELGQLELIDYRGKGLPLMESPVYPVVLSLN